MQHKKQDKEEKVQVFRQLRDSKELERLKKVIQEEHKGQINSQCYFKHSNQKLLCSFLIFGLISHQKFEQKREMKQILQKTGLSKNKKKELKHTYVGWDKNISIASLFWEKRDGFLAIQKQFEDFCSKLTIEGIQKLMRLGFENLPIHIQLQQGDERKQICKDENSQNWLSIIKSNNSYILAIHSKAEGSIIENDPKEQQISKKENIYSQISDSSQDTTGSKLKKAQSEDLNDHDYKIGYKDPFKIHKAYSQGDNPPAEEIQSNEVTWFEILIVLVIILALLSQFFHILDPILEKINSLGAHYHFLQLGYKINKIMSRNQHRGGL